MRTYEGIAGRTGKSISQYRRPPEACTIGMRFPFATPICPASMSVAPTENKSPEAIANIKNGSAFFLIMIYSDKLLRYFEGDTPVMFLNARLNPEMFSNPTMSAISVMLWLLVLNSCFANRMRHIEMYCCGEQ